MRFAVTLIMAATVMVLGSGCTESSGHEGTAVGAITEVAGNLSGIESFVVLDVNGDSFKFTRRDGLLVMGAPPSHLGDHVISGEPVEVTCHEDESGELIADELTDIGA